jgi:hypothetical protein
MQLYSMTGQISPGDGQPSLGGMSDLSRSLGVADPSGMNFMDTTISSALTQPLFSYFRDNDDPWNTVSVHNGGNSGILFNVLAAGRTGLPAAAFGADRRDRRSDCDTAIWSDSGYVSGGLRPSVAGSSNYGDSDPPIDGRSICVPVSNGSSPDLQSQARVSQQTRIGPYTISHVGQDISNPPTASGPQLQCQVCGEKVKNKSQLK